MRTLVLFLLVVVSGVARASEAAAPEVEVTETEAAAEVEVAPSPDTPVEAADPGTAAPGVADAGAVDVELAVATEPSGPQPQFRFVDLPVQYARKHFPGSPADLYAPVPPPAVVADGLGLLVERRFAR